MKMDEYSGYKELATEMCVRAAVDLLTAKYIMTLPKDDPMLKGMPVKYNYAFAKKIAPFSYANCLRFLKEKSDIYCGKSAEELIEQTEKVWVDKSGRLDKWNFWSQDDRREMVYYRNATPKVAEKLRMTANQLHKSQWGYACETANAMRLSMNYVIDEQKRYVKTKDADLMARRIVRLMKMNELHKLVPDHKILKLDVSCVAVEGGKWCAYITERGEEDEFMRAYADTYGEAMDKLITKMEATKEEMDDYCDTLSKLIKARKRKEC